MISTRRTSDPTLNADSTGNHKVLKDFDNKYGTRRFRCTGSGGSKNVNDGDDGFSCFLDQIVSPVIDNDPRVQTGDPKCAELVASCSLVQNSTQVNPDNVGQGTYAAMRVANVNLHRR
jgi:hypothetical protein